MSPSVRRKMVSLLTPFSVTDITSAETARWEGDNKSSDLTCLQQVSEHFCPDGLVFDETSTSYAKCGFPFSIDCTGECHTVYNSWCNIWILQEEKTYSQRSPHQAVLVRRDTFPILMKRWERNSLFHLEIICFQVCNKFNFCTRGVPNSITCAGGLIFDPLLGQCDYSDQVNRCDICTLMIRCPYPLFIDRPGCTSGDLFSFQCPETESAHEHNRYPAPEGDIYRVTHSLLWSLCRRLLQVLSLHHRQCSAAGLWPRSGV